LASPVAANRNNLPTKESCASQPNAPMFWLAKRLQVGVHDSPASFDTQTPPVAQPANHWFLLFG
jgi:hypothetical protein